jgi:hypothetical protein
MFRFKEILSQLLCGNQNGSARSKYFRRAKLRLEQLESRELMATFTVTSIADSGAGTLRNAITQANATAGADIINFAIPAVGVQTIAPLTALPTITDPVTIDGRTQGGAASDPPLIEINGANAGAAASGLVITGGSSTINALTINRFKQNGIVLNSNNNSVLSCQIGTDSAGGAIAANVLDGIQISGSANTIGGTAANTGNIISGNSRHGIQLINSTATSNNILGNTIGMNRSQNAKLPNASNGVRLGEGANANTVGGIAVGARNFISGNGSFGVLLEGLGTNNNLVQGNYIGNGSGSATAFGNSSGIGIRNAAKNNTVGSVDLGGQNILSGNSSFGVSIQGTGTTGNQVIGNRIGTNQAGTAALANGFDGVLIDSGASDNTIGGNSAAHKNILSGNLRHGVRISGVGTSNNKIFNNRIGLNAAGRLAIANGQGGVEIRSGATNNLVGDTAVGNQISGNSGAGVLIRNVGTSGNAVRSNFIGSNSAGDLTPNSLDGVVITEGATNNTVGGTNNNDHANVIGGHSRAGILISGLGTNSNFIQSNRIGTNFTTQSNLPNAIGVWISGGAKSNRVGGPAAFEPNIISSNSSFGVLVSGAGTDSNQIQGNFIGTNTNALTQLPNGLDGVYIGAGAKNTLIGGTTAGAGNLIVSNGRDGVGVEGSGTTGTSVLGNAIGVNKVLQPLPNSRFGVFIRGGATGTIIGNTTTQGRNVISANGSDGIRLEGGGVNAVVRNNIIGLAADGSSNRGNGGNGVTVKDGAVATIGGTATNAGNVIAANSADGVLLQGLGTNGSVVQGNLIGTSLNGLINKGNLGRGVAIQFGVNGATIGGSTAGSGNVISGNTQSGIQVTDATTQNIVIRGNLIGTDSTGSSAMANLVGILINFARNITIGGAVPGSRNVVSGNSLEGILIEGNNVAGGPSGTTIQGNYIGLNATGNSALPNRDGIQLLRADESVLIGGANVNAANFISGNTRTGISMFESTGHRVIGNRIGLRADGVSPQGNAYHGVFILRNSSGNSIGGVAAGEGNVIAHNGGDGVLIGSDPGFGVNDLAGGGNSILCNLIFANVGQAIDLGPNDGATANDVNDGDFGSNGLQNKPVLSLVTSSGDSTLVTGTLDSAIGRFRIEFFAGSVNGQAEQYLGATTDSITGASDLSIGTILNINVAPGLFVMAVATNLDTGDSSELSFGITSFGSLMPPEFKTLDDVSTWETGREELRSKTNRRVSRLN